MMSVRYLRERLNQNQLEVRPDINDELKVALSLPIT
jgi:hypothetical protein